MVFYGIYTQMVTDKCVLGKVIVELPVFSEHKQLDGVQCL